MLTEAYADDLTIMFKWGRVGLKRILKILQEFEMVSGLKINVKKTQLMITGGDGEIIGEEIDGIIVVNEINVLGVTIDRKLLNLDRNWEKTILDNGILYQGKCKAKANNFKNTCSQLAPNNNVCLQRESNLKTQSREQLWKEENPN